MSNFCVKKSENGEEVACEKIGNTMESTEENNEIKKFIELASMNTK